MGYDNLGDYEEGQRGWISAGLPYEGTHHDREEKGRTRIPEGYEDLLESTALVHVATIGPNGEPQNIPVPPTSPATSGS